MHQQTRVIAAVFGLSGFAVATLAGLSANNSAGTVILHALLAMIACQVVGVCCGAMLQRVVDDHAKRLYASPPGSGGGSDFPTHSAQSAGVNSSTSEKNR